MGILWFDARQGGGQASLYASNLTLNVEAAVPFEFAYRVQVGVDEKKNIVIVPYSKERVDRGDLDEYLLLPIQFAKSYARICSTSLMERLSGWTGLSLGKTPVKLPTEWRESENRLIIFLNKEGQQQ